MIKSDLFLPGSELNWVLDPVGKNQTELGFWEIFQKHLMDQAEVHTYRISANDFLPWALSSFRQN
jgi:hypothetical protein